MAKSHFNFVVGDFDNERSERQYGCYVFPVYYCVKPIFVLSLLYFFLVPTSDQVFNEIGNPEPILQVLGIVFLDSSAAKRPVVT